MPSPFIENESLVASLKACGPRVALPELPLLRQSGPFKSSDQFLESAWRSFAELLHFTELRPESDVLDYGCGMGRLAIPLSQHLTGFYLGLDTAKKAVEHCRSTFGNYPNMDFRHVDIYSKMFNPNGGRMASRLDLNLENSFDVAVLFSVFTHVLPADAPTLLDFLFAAMKPGGEILASFFLLNMHSSQRIKSGRASRTFAHRYETVLIDNPDVPEGAVAYFEDRIKAMIMAAGFELMFVNYGTWSGIPSLHYQDNILLRRPMIR